MNFAGQEIPLQRFSGFLPPTTIGEVDELAFPAGQAVGFVQDIRPAREIIIEMVDEARAVLNGLLANR
jgi:NAD(P)H-dependent flavin oxidoreductase YrpB (nitropropane dioxygenase family)